MRPGHRVDLDAEGRHGEGVDHVGAGDQHARHGVDRHDQLVVDGEQARIGRESALPAACRSLSARIAELKESVSWFWYS